MKAKEFLKENFSSLVKVCVLIIAFLLPILLLIFIWKNYFHTQNQLEELILILKCSNPQKVNLETLAQYLDDRMNFNFTIFISLIDITIAVWLGLNIYNTLSKNEMKVLKEELSEKLKTMNQKIESLDSDILKLDTFFLVFNEKEPYRKIMYCQKLIEKDPSSYQTYNLLGNIYFYSGDYKKALMNYKKAIEKRNEFYFAAEFNCCECLIYLELYDDAIEKIEYVLEHNDTDFEVYLILAEVYRRKKDYDLAIKYNHKAYQLSDENYYVLSMYGSIYFDWYENDKDKNDSSMKEKAKKYFERTIAEKPDFEEAHYYLAEIYKDNDEEKYNEHLKKSKGIVPDYI